MKNGDFSGDVEGWHAREAVLEAVKLDGWVLRDASEELRGDKGVVLAAVKQHGNALQFASAALRGDTVVVSEAVKESGWALQFASKTLQNDTEVVLEAVKEYGPALEYASEELQNDREVVLAAVKQDGLALEYASEELRGDTVAVSAAVKQDEGALQFASEALQKKWRAGTDGEGWNDRDLFLEAVKQDENALQFASEARQREAADAAMASLLEEEEEEEEAKKGKKGNSKKKNKKKKAKDCKQQMQSSLPAEAAPAVPQRHQHAHDTHAAAVEETTSAKHAATQEADAALLAALQCDDEKDSKPFADEVKNKTAAALQEDKDLQQALEASLADAPSFPAAPDDKPSALKGLPVPMEIERVGPIERPAEPPDAFVCPISFELMEDPVVCSDGHTYERVVIQDWLRKNDTSPKTNQRLDPVTLFPNHNLKAAIGEWAEQHRQ
jgi:hypothetical protein